MTSKDITRRDQDEIAAFVERLRSLPDPARQGGVGRLIFALDATA
jgi:hypothetical protein